MKPIRTRILRSFIMTVCLLLALSGTASGAGALQVTGGTLDTDYTYAGNLLTILTDTPLTISGSTTTDRILVAADVHANITLSDISIEQTNSVSAFKIENNSSGNVSIILVGSNRLQSGLSCAGLEKNGVGEGIGTLTIGGEGSLTAVGGENGAGIGSVYNGGGSSNITIDGATVIAEGGRSAAGIGGGNGSACNNIIVNNSTVTAEGGTRGAGIGGGKNSAWDNITIENGSNVTATGGELGTAGIGGGDNGGSGTIIISDSTVTATAGGATGGGAGIGGGYEAGGGMITISDSTVTATGWGSGAGIGGGGNRGDGGTITISGGTVIATGYGYASGIGGGGQGDGGTVSISNDAVVFAKGDAANGSKDIGGGKDSASDGILSVSDTAAVFLYNGNGPGEGYVTCVDGHTLSASMDYADRLYGIAIPADANWSGATSIGAYLRLVALAYAANEGSGIVPEQQQHIDTTGTLQAGSGLSRPNYTFNGWNTQANGSGANYAPGDSFTFDTNTTLYAKWTEKTVVSMPQTAQSYTYDGAAKAFVIAGTPDTDFTVTYNQGAGNLSPVNPGSYNVVITRSEDETYAAYSVTIENGLVITPVAVDIAEISGVTAPVRGATPVSTVTETEQYTGTVSWTPAVTNTFAAATEYTATIELTPKTPYTMTGVTADFFTVTGATSTGNNADSGNVTAVFPATGAAPSGRRGGGSSSTPTNNVFNAEITAGGGTDLSLPVTVDNGTASVDTGTESLNDNGTTVAIPSIPDVHTYKANIPVSALSTAGKQGSLTLKTDAGNVTVPSDMLTNVDGIRGSKAEISVGQGDKESLPDAVKAAIGDRPLVQLMLSLDGRQTDWSNPSAPVTVSIPYTPTATELSSPESIVIWYIDGGDNVVTVPNGRYDAATGTVTFSTTHFSDYAVAYNRLSFNDVEAGSWYNKAVSFIAAREITGGTGNDNYRPEARLTRGEFIVLTMRAYDIEPDANPTDNFSDAGKAYYTDYLAAAKRLGITAGTGNNLYAPDNQITRQEMFTLLFNALKIIGRLPQDDSGKMLSQFTDAEEISDWAQEAMTLLVKTGTVGGSNGRLTPAGTTTRAEMAQVLYNLLGK